MKILLVLEEVTLSSTTFQDFVVDSVFFFYVFECSPRLHLFITI